MIFQQSETHRYCHQLSEDLMQCVLFDGNEKDSKLNGLEWIISDKFFQVRFRINHFLLQIQRNLNYI